MSSIYLTEPPTQGKVLIKTTFGDIDVELWAKEAPLACRNFIQLSLEGYYDSTIVHRIVKGFMVQMGDPTGTGTGGKSIWGRPFKDEAHGRIKFNHRGQVAMANENAPNTNQSQFFITLDACEWLDRKHTIFGKVTGNTIFNVLRLGEIETGGEGGDRPLEELKIKGIEVLWNPFDDIVPRDLGKSKTDSSANNAQSDKSKNIKAVKDKKLLSFGDDEDQDGEDGATFSIKMKSSHDTKSKSKKSKSSTTAEPAAAASTADSGLSRYGDSSSNSNSKSGTGAPSRAPAAAAADNKNNNDSGDDEEGEGGSGGVNQAADFDRMMRSELIKKRQMELAAESAKHNNGNNNRSFTGTNNGDDVVIMDHSGMEDALHDSKRSGALKDKSDTYKKLKEDLLRSRRAVSVMTGSDAAKLQEESAFKEMVSPLEQRRLKYMKRKSEHGDRSEETMEKLKKFTSAIRSTKQQLSSTTTEEESNGNSVENYHGQVLEQDERDVDPEKEKRELQTWFVGKLKCKKHIDDNYRNKNGEGMSADGRYTDDYMVIDPLKQRGSSNNDRSAHHFDRAVVSEMFKASEEFEGAIDINHILNDASLHDELASLGWKDHVVKKKTVAKPGKPPKPSAAAPPPPTKQESLTMEPLDIGDVGLVDESALTLTEQDMQDEGLLAEFDFINAEANGENEDDSGEEEHEEEAEESEEEEEDVSQPVLKPAANAAKSPAVAPSQVNRPADNSGIPTVEEAKRNAIKYKREGNTTEALKWLRYAKQIETSAVNSPTLPPGVVYNPPPTKPTKPTPAASTTAGKPQATANQATYIGNHSENASSYSTSDPFGPLESAIAEASKSALKEAKALEKSDPKVAVVKLREYKALQQEMAVLQSRRNTPGAAPALFHWATTRTETKIENMSIAEDEVKLTIEGLFDVSGLIESHSSRSVGISYLLGINKDETVPVVTPQYKYENGSVKMNYTVTLPILKRGKHVQTLYARKKATFDIILYKGFWKGNETLCSAVLPLADLITKSSVGGPIALKSVSAEGSSGKKAKALGGSLNVTVSIRSPLGGPEIVYSEERKLVIEPWPPVVTPMHVPVPVPVVQNNGGSGVKASSVDAERVGTPTTAAPTTDTVENKPAPLTGAMATLTEKERTDPHNVDFIESNDVLEYEIATAQALMSSSTDEDEQFNSNMRVQLLNTKLQLLVYSVQNETLTMEQYLENIKNRVKRDQLIALYFKNLGDKENVDIALQVMKRVTIMKKEIQNAEEAQQEEDK